MDVKLFQSIQYTDEEEQFERANRIWNTFINTKDVLEVNLPQSIVAAIKDILSKYTPSKNKEPSSLLCGIFDDACNDIYWALSNVYFKWISSNSYRCMISDIDSKTKLHTRSERQIAASRLIKFFESERQFIENSSTIAPLASFSDEPFGENQLSNGIVPLSRSVSPNSPIRESLWLRMTPHEYEVFYWLSNAFCINQIGLEFVE